MPRRLPRQSVWILRRFFASGHDSPTHPWVCIVYVQSASQNACSCERRGRAWSHQAHFGPERRQTHTDTDTDTNNVISLIGGNCGQAKALFSSRLARAPPSPPKGTSNCAPSFPRACGVWGMGVWQRTIWVRTCCCVNISRRTPGGCAACGRCACA